MKGIIGYINFRSEASLEDGSTCTCDTPISKFHKKASAKPHNNNNIKNKYPAQTISSFNPESQPPNSLPRIIKKRKKQEATNPPAIPPTREKQQKLKLIECNINSIIIERIKQGKRGRPLKNKESTLKDNNERKISIVCDSHAHALAPAHSNDNNTNIELCVEERKRDEKERRKSRIKKAQISGRFHPQLKKRSDDYALSNVVLPSQTTKNYSILKHWLNKSNILTPSFTPIQTLLCSKQTDSLHNNQSVIAEDIQNEEDLSSVI